MMMRKAEERPLGARGAVMVFTAVALLVVLAVLFSNVDNWTVPSTPTVPAVAGGTVTGTPVPTAVGVAVVQTATPDPTVVGGGEEGGPLPNSAACVGAPAGWRPYTVRVGDTVSRLSLRSGATIAEIERVNCLKTTALYAGQRLYLPEVPPTRPPCGPPGYWIRYTVQAGDTMFSLARSRDTTVYAVKVANCLTSTSIFVGRQLYLPPPTVTATPPPTETPVPVPPTNTPVPTTVVTVIVTATPSPTRPPTVTPTPSNTPVVPPTDTPISPSATPVPTDTPIPASATPVPTDTPIPASATPMPTDTPIPASATPVPTDTPISPSVTPVPTDTPVPATNTPSPTETPSPPTRTPVPSSTPNVAVTIAVPTPTADTE